MNTKKSLTIIFGLFLTGPAFAANNTPDYYKCSYREGGEWNYGRAPQVCSANSFGSDSYLVTNYSSVFFADTASRSGERVRYMGEIHAVTRDAAKAYLLKKKPSASTTEVNAWIEAVVTTAAHESFFSMYRRTSDSRLKMMRGDYGHGHGLMQIDDRHHYSAINNGLAWNLGSHYTYAMDILYTAWRKASTLSCVTGASNYWQAHIRSAWAIYNGGSAKGCRWTNPNDRWAQNDKNFYTSLTKKAWRNHVSNTQQATKIPISCLMEKEACSVTEPGNGSTRPLEGRLYKVDSQICLVKNQRFFCLPERDRQCLNAIGPASNETALTWTAAQAKVYGIEQQDRHQLCPQYDRNLIPVASGLRVLKNINLRDTPAGGLVTVVPVNSVLQVRDFEVRNANGDRYYKVSYQGKSGYLYAGTLSDNSSWGVPVSSSLSAPSTMARVGDSIRVVNLYGINIRSTPGGSLLGNIPKGASVRISEALAQGPEDKLYYKITYQNITGYIYAGYTMPSETLTDWAQVLP